MTNSSGSGTGTGTVRVTTGATLGGTGSIAGPANVDTGATLDPGIAGAGRLTLGGTLHLDRNATLALQFGGLTAGTQYDQIAVTGQVTLGGNLNVTLINGFTLAVGQTFAILVDTATTSVVGTFDNARAGTYTDPSGNVFQVNYAANIDAGSVANDVTLRYVGNTAVPEPSAWALWGIGAGGLLLAMRRRGRGQSAIS